MPGYMDFKYTIETITIEIARLQTAMRLQDAQPVLPEYGVDLKRERATRFNGLIVELQYAIELLQKEAKKHEEAYAEMQKEARRLLGRDDG